MSFVLRPTPNGFLTRSLLLPKANGRRMRLAFADFRATHHGNAVPDAPDLNLGAVRTVGLLIGDNQEGRFELLISEVEAYKE